MKMLCRASVNSHPHAPGRTMPCCVVSTGERSAWNFALQSASASSTASLSFRSRCARFSASKEAAVRKTSVN